MVTPNLCGAFGGRGPKKVRPRPSLSFSPGNGYAKPGRKVRRGDKLNNCDRSLQWPLPARGGEEQTPREPQTRERLEPSSPRQCPLFQLVACIAAPVQRPAREWLRQTWVECWAGELPRKCGRTTCSAERSAWEWLRQTCVERSAGEDPRKCGHALR